MAFNTYRTHPSQRLRNRIPLTIHIPPGTLHSMPNTKLTLETDLICLRKLRLLYEYSPSMHMKRKCNDYDMDDLLLVENFVHGVAARHRKAREAVHSLGGGALWDGDSQDGTHSRKAYKVLVDLVTRLDGELVTALRWLDLLGRWRVETRLESSEEESDA